MSRRIGRVGFWVVVLLLALCAALALAVRAGEIRGAWVEVRPDAPLAPVTGAAGAQTGPRQTTGRKLAALPLYFIKNEGQLDPQVAYYVQGKDKTLYFTAQGVTFALRRSAASVIARSAATTPASATQVQTSNPAVESWGLLRPRLAMTEDASRRWAVKLEFVGANPHVQPLGVDETGAVISYFKGRRDEWVTGAKAYSGVVYRDLWPGIDLEYSGLVNLLKYQFVVHPGADPSQIRLAYHGAAEVTVDEAGRMHVSTPAGGFEDDAPYAYQQDESGEKVEIEVSYEFLSSSHEYGLRVGDYDPSRPLILDPTVLNYCGYLGGLGTEYAEGIAVDSAGNAYVTGSSDSDHTSFPVAVGPDQIYNGDTDAFVAKVRGDGSGLVYCGYIGGSAYEEGFAIAVDSTDHAYIAGGTQSDETQGFPMAIGPYVVHSGLRDAFVAKVRADGTDLVYCGYIGGTGIDTAYAIAVDGFGSAYVAGDTYSEEDEGFPVLVGPDLTHGGGQTDAFVAKVSADGSGLLYCGYIGGTEHDHAYGIAVDGSGSAHVAGRTDSNPGAGFPVTVGPDVTHNGYEDGFVAKVRSDGTGLDYCGYIGGGSNDACKGIALDSTGNAYVVGDAWSDETTFPVIVGPDVTYNAGELGDAFVAKVRAGGTGLDYCGYIGGIRTDRGNAIAVDGEGRAHVAGNTYSREDQGFPVVDGPDLTHNGGSTDAYVARVASDGTHLDYCGYIGGAGGETCLAIALDGGGNAYVAGWTTSSEALGFPVAMGPDLTFGGGTQDAFVARVGENRAPTLGVVMPDSGSSKTGVTVYFTTTWKDADGRQDLKQCYFHIGATAVLPGNVTLMYNAKKGKLWMLNDAGTTWLGGYAPGSPTPIENSQAKLHVSDTKVTGVNDTVGVGWAIEFKKDYTGPKKTGLKCKDEHKAKAKGKWKGTWLIY